MAFRCPRCDFVHVKTKLQTPAPELYDERYYDVSYRTRETEQSHFFRHQLNKIESIKETGRLLDVGFGTGLFLHSAADRGWEVVGIDPSPAAFRLAAEKYGTLALTRSTLKDARFPTDSFDVVTLWDVLAHVPDLKTELTEIARVLKTGGLLIIKTPNRPSRVFRAVGMMAWWRKSLAEHLLYIPRQQNHFTPANLALGLSRYDFRILDWEAFDDPPARPSDTRRGGREVGLRLVQSFVRRLQRFDSFVAYAKRQAGESRN